MSTHAAAPVSSAEVSGGWDATLSLPADRSAAALWLLAAVTAVGVAVRFSSLGLQSYHHDEVVTAMRVISGSFGHMLHAVKTSESNPPLYYVLAWGWIKLFGSAEFGLRSLSALLGAATVPVGYLIGMRLTSRRTGLILAALLAVNPMLIWYSQEARSYALLIFFGAVSMYFFVSSLQSRRRRDIWVWALSSALALCSHYFAFFAVAIEGVWLLWAFRAGWRLFVPALAAVFATGVALLPLIVAQINPAHIGWIEDRPLPLRLFDAGASFLIGETGWVIAEPARTGYALIPVILVGAGLALVATRGTFRERRRAALALILGLGVAGLASAAALAGKDYVVERNLLPALIPLAAAAAIGFGSRRARHLGLLLAVFLCVYWLAFDVHVTQTPNLQRPDYRGLTEQFGAPTGRRAIVGWRLAAEPVRWYLDDHARRFYAGAASVSEVDTVSKRLVTGRPTMLPDSFRAIQRLRLGRLTLTRYRSQQPMRLSFHTLHSLPTGFGGTAVVLDGPRVSAFATRSGRVGIAPAVPAVSR